MNEKLLVLGSDYNSINVVKEAKKIGMYVVVADLMNSSPTKNAADESWLISTTDIDLLEKKCNEIGITAIMFGASDFNVSQARKLCKRLSLPIYCDNDYTWEVARNKRMFKDICKKVGAPVAEDYYLSDQLTNEEIEKVQFPVVVKPFDKSGNRGMSYCNNVTELRAAWKAARLISDNNIIIERRLNGPEFNVHYVIADGEMSLLYFSATHHQPGELENIYSFKYTTSAYLKQYISEVNDKVIDVFKKAGCKEGIAWVDVIRDKDGKFYCLEMGYRFGGVMTYMPFQEVSGFNTIGWMLDIARGIKHKVIDLPPTLNKPYKGIAASYHLFSSTSGVISSIDGLDYIKDMEGVWIDCPKREGSEIRLYANSGLIGIYGKDIDDLCLKVSRINSKLAIRNDKGNNMIILFTDEESVRREYWQGIIEFDKSQL